MYPEDYTNISKTVFVRVRVSKIIYFVVILAHNTHADPPVENTKRSSEIFKMYSFVFEMIFPPSSWMHTAYSFLKQF